MMKSVKLFLGEFIDYTGLFAAEKPSLEEALQNYVSYCHSSERWLLSRFLIAIDQLEQLTPSLLEGNGLIFSLVGRAGQSKTDFLENLGADLQKAAAFRRQYGRHILIDAIELKLPQDMLDPDDWEGTVSGLKDLLAASAALIEREGAILPFYEFPFTPAELEPAAWERYFRVMAEGIAAHNHSVRSIDVFGEARPHYRPAALKLRYGGAAPELLPTSEQIAAAIDACRRNNIPFKVTSGLHRPLTHFDPDLGAQKHGFLNIFGAAILACAHRLKQTEIEAILAEENEGGFRFEENAFSWQELSATNQRIREARESLILSMGSYSLDKPRKGLQALGLL